MSLADVFFFLPLADLLHATEGRHEEEEEEEAFCMCQLTLNKDEVRECEALLALRKLHTPTAHA